MRDRLVELIKKAYSHGIKTAFESEENNKSIDELVADHLLADGVIVPPYKPMPLIDEGDRVLCPICETDLMGYYIGHDNEPTVVTCFECGAWIDSTKAVTREEEEKALSYRRKDPGENQEEIWKKNLDRLINGEFGKYNTKVFGNCAETLARYWRAQAEAGYPGANDNFNYFMSCIKERDGER